MQLKPEDLKKILLDSNLLTEEQFEFSVKSSKSQGIDLQDFILENNYIKDEELGQLDSNYLNFPYIALTQFSIPDDILHTIPEVVARKQKVIAFKKDDKGIHVATSNTGDVQIVGFLKKKTGENIILYYATKKDIREALALYAKDAAKAFDKIMAENIKQAKGSVGKAVDLPIIKIVETIISYAYRNKASDVHLEPEETYSLLRFRVDGMLHDIVRLPKNIHSQMVTRIKVMSNLRTDEHQSPQDGKIREKIDDETLNLRVSVVPVSEGEKIVLRLLSEQSRRLSLADLGFQDESLTRIEHSYKKPYGMILTTGPTGSGTTTTLYAILKVLNKRVINIMTIEDPVEYDIEGVNQIQINTKSHLTFASGLRAIVRQDPDVILVGEIRDQETAKIAVNSAMTGHLVLSTLHTNDAATTIPRLFDMGVEPFLIASSVNVIVGQRLVRKICEHCRVSVDLKGQELKDQLEHFPKELIKKHFGKKSSLRVYIGKGCDICHGTGYQGRIGIYEVMEMTDEIRELIVNRATSDDISEAAMKSGMLTMIEDGMEKVKQGVTTIEEVIRVTKE